MATSHISLVRKYFTVDVAYACVVDTTLKINSNSIEVTLETSIPYVLTYKSKNLGQFCPLKIRGSTYVRVTVCQHMCHQFFCNTDDVSSAGAEGRFAHSAAISPRGSLTCHISLRNLILQRDERAGEEYSVFHAVLPPGLPGRLSLSPSVACYALCCTIRRDWHSTVTAVGLLPVLQWAWLAHDWHRKWHHSGSVAPCCDQLLISLQYTWTFHTVAARGTLLIASATSLER